MSEYIIISYLLGVLSLAGFYVWKRPLCSRCESVKLYMRRVKEDLDIAWREDKEEAVEDMEDFINDQLD